MDSSKIDRLNFDYDIISFEIAHKCDGKFYLYPEEDYYTPVKKEVDSFVKYNDLDPELVIVSYKPKEPHIAYGLVNKKIESILSNFGSCEYGGFLTGRNNFRYKIATILPYKGNREKSRKPHLLQDVREYLKANHGAVQVDGEEADDALSYSQTETSCLVSTDKDMNQVAGWHFDWNKNKLFYVTELDGLRYFYQQLLTGDDGDNILGLFGVAAKSKLCDKVREATTEEEMFDVVSHAYKQRFGSYWSQFLLENGRLLRIRKRPEEMWELPS